MAEMPADLREKLLAIANLRGFPDHERDVYDALLEAWPLIAAHVAERCAEICIKRAMRVGHRALPISTGEACAAAIRKEWGVTK